MSLNLLKPVYPCRPITSVSTLATMLRVSEADLAAIAANASRMYRASKPKAGSTRQTFDALPALKALHRRLKATVLSRVLFPGYLTGSLLGSDYKTNAELHSNKRVVICEDVKGFFGAVSAARVYDVWLNVFRFSPDVARLLSQLTTKDGALPQGGIPSSYLANLVLWRDEPLLQAKLMSQGITYSRYVDDIVMSSNQNLTDQEKTQLIGAVYGMLRRTGLHAKREKHEIAYGTERMIVTKLIVNRKPSLPVKKRANVRVAVREAEKAYEQTGDVAKALKSLEHAANRVGQLGRFHPNLSAPLKDRIKRARTALPEVAFAPVITGNGNFVPDVGDGATPPW